MNSIKQWAGTLAVMATGAALGTGCGGEDGGHVSAAVANITTVPTGVSCIDITAVGNRTSSKRFTVTAGQSSVLALTGLPVGSVVFTSSAYSSACTAVTTTSVPTWISDPVTATLTAGVSYSLNLVLRRNGRASVGVDFNDGPAVDAGADAGATTDAGTTADAGTDAGPPDTGACASPLTLCAAACVDTASDNAHCGACGNACSLANATSSCVSGLCGVTSCASGFADCDGAPANGCEINTRTTVNHCGACGALCPPVANGTSTCVSGACGFTCNAGFVLSGGACVAPTPPRPMAPLSTATVTSQRPLLRWALTSGDGAHVELCRDRALTTGCVAFDVTGTAGEPASDLAPGVWFWRLAARTGAVTTGATGPVWQFAVGARTAPVNSSSGTTLDLNGDGFADAVVGATGSDSASVYFGGPGLLAPFASLTLTGPGPGSGFGSSVASAGDLNGDGYADLVVGTPLASRAYVYFGGPSPSAVPSLILMGSGGRFGGSVASAGDLNGDGYGDLVVGASDASRAYVYFGAASPPLSPSATLLTPDGSPTFGYSVAGAGDVNGDGYADLVVGSNTANRAYVYFGASAIPSGPSLLLNGPGGSSRFGVSVAGAGDVNGDGYADFIVGASDSSAAYVYFGDSSPAPIPALTLGGPGPGSRFGISVASAGDVNGDGYADLIVGASIANQAGVFFGGPSPSSGVSLILTGPSGGEFGQSVASAGDLNGDGFADFIAGAPGASAAYVYVGGVSPSSGPARTLTGGGSFGVSVASAIRVPGATPRARASRRS